MITRQSCKTSDVLICSPPFRRSGDKKRPLSKARGTNRLPLIGSAIIILPNQSKNVNPRSTFRTLDKSRVSGIIKITKAPSARTVWPRIKLAFQEISKPSLCRVAVSAIYADGDRESKDMERDRNRHKHPSFRRRPNRPSASGALGFDKNRLYFIRPVEKCQSVPVSVRLTDQGS